MSSYVPTQPEVCAHIQKAEAEEKVSAQSFIVFSSREKQIFLLSQRNYGALKCGFHRGTPQCRKSTSHFPTNVMDAAMQQTTTKDGRTSQSGRINLPILFDYSNEIPYLCHVSQARTNVVKNMNTNNPRQKVIISLTSFPAAISYAARAIRSLLDGSVLPDKLVLYLTFSQFGEKGIPDELLRMAEENPVFEIRNYDRDIRSYRKLIPALQDFPDAVIVTTDDDVAYHRHMLRDLLRLHEQMPDAVLAHRAKRMKPGKPYRRWSKYRWYDFVFKRIHSGFKNIQTGVGGVLYPPHCLKTDMLDEDLFTRIAPTTDDIWFWAAAVANGTPVIPVPFGHNKPRGVGKPRELSLKTSNFKSGTDRNAAALKAIVEHYPAIGRRIGYEIHTDKPENT